MFNQQDLTDLACPPWEERPMKSKTQEIKIVHAFVIFCRVQKWKHQF